MQVEFFSGAATLTSVYVVMFIADPFDFHRVASLFQISLLSVLFHVCSRFVYTCIRGVTRLHYTY